MTHIIAEPCIDNKHKKCVEVCPVDCIYEGKQQFYINPEECIDCGVCVPECPEKAIYPADEVPEKWIHDIVINYEFFGLKKE